MKKITFLALVLMLIFPISSYGTDGQRKISQTPSTTFPIVINQAGSYVLTSNLVVTDPNVNAIEITANNVTLDLNGHIIQGPNTGSGTGSGIYSQNPYGITIKNGKVQEFGYYGIYLIGTSEGEGNIVEDIS